MPTIKRMSLALLSAFAVLSLSACAGHQSDNDNGNYGITASKGGGDGDYGTQGKGDGDLYSDDDAGTVGTGGPAYQDPGAPPTAAAGELPTALELSLGKGTVDSSEEGQKKYERYGFYVQSYVKTPVFVQPTYAGNAPDASFQVFDKPIKSEVKEATEENIKHDTIDLHNARYNPKVALNEQEDLSTAVFIHDVTSVGDFVVRDGGTAFFYGSNVNVRKFMALAGSNLTFNGTVSTFINDGGRVLVVPGYKEKVDNEDILQVAITMQDDSKNLMTPYVLGHLADNEKSAVNSFKVGMVVEKDFEQKSGRLVFLGAILAVKGKATISGGDIFTQYHNQSSQPVTDVLLVSPNSIDFDASIPVTNFLLKGDAKTPKASVVQIKVGEQTLYALVETLPADGSATSNTNTGSSVSDEDDGDDYTDDSSDNDDNYNYDDDDEEWTGSATAVHSHQDRNVSAILHAIPDYEVMEAKTMDGKKLSLNVRKQTRFNAFQSLLEANPTVAESITKGSNFTVALDNHLRLQQLVNNLNQVSVLQLDQLRGYQAGAQVGYFFGQQERGLALTQLQAAARLAGLVGQVNLDLAYQTYNASYTLDADKNTKDKSHSFSVGLGAHLMYGLDQLYPGLSALANVAYQHASHSVKLASSMVTKETTLDFANDQVSLGLGVGQKFNAGQVSFKPFAAYEVSWLHQGKAAVQSVGGQLDVEAYSAVRNQFNLGVIAEMNGVAQLKGLRLTAAYTMNVRVGKAPELSAKLNKVDLSYVSQENTLTHQLQLQAAYQQGALQWSAGARVLYNKSADFGLTAGLNYQF